eukprot:gene25572-11223_t
MAGWKCASCSVPSKVEADCGEHTSDIPFSVYAQDNWLVKNYPGFSRKRLQEEYCKEHLKCFKTPTKWDFRKVFGGITRLSGRKLEHEIKRGVNMVDLCFAVAFTADRIRQDNIRACRPELSLVELVARVELAVERDSFVQDTVHLNLPLQEFAKYYLGTCEQKIQQDPNDASASLRTSSPSHYDDCKDDVAKPLLHAPSVYLHELVQSLKQRVSNAFQLCLPLELLTFLATLPTTRARKRGAEEEAGAEEEPPNKRNCAEGVEPPTAKASSRRALTVRAPVARESAKGSEQPRASSSQGIPTTKGTQQLSTALILEGHKQDPQSRMYRLMAAMDEHMAAMAKGQVVLCRDLADIKNHLLGAGSSQSRGLGHDLTKTLPTLPTCLKNMPFQKVLQGKRDQIGEDALAAFKESLVQAPEDSSSASPTTQPSGPPRRRAQLDSKDTVEEFPLPCPEAVDCTIPGCAQAGLLAWNEYKGTALKLQKLGDLLHDWDVCIKPNDDCVFTDLAPLRILEIWPLRQFWRSGPSMRKVMLMVKTIVYALHRRVVRLQFPDEDGNQIARDQEAKAQLLQEAKAQLFRDNRLANNAPMSKLYTALQKEKPTPSDYENTDLGGNKNYNDFFLLKSSEW